MDLRISQLPGESALTPTTLLVVVENGETRRSTVATLTSYLNNVISGTTDTFVTGATLSGTVLEIVQNEGKAPVNVELSGLTAGAVSSYSEVILLSAATPTQITHNLNTPNIMVQTWDSSNDLVDMYVGKFSGDTNNAIIVETTSGDTYNINILGL